MDKKLTISDPESIESFELKIMKGLHSSYQKQSEELDSHLSTNAASILFKHLSEIEGYEITKDNIYSFNIPRVSFCAAVDKTLGVPDALINPSHEYKKFSLIKHYPAAQRLVPKVDYILSPLKNALASMDIRSNEILREFSADNTERAFNGDLVYWQAWLSAVGFDFESPVSIDHVKLFAIQHVEGIPQEIDKKLVDQRYKQSLGPHKISTIKRRLASLSVALDLEKLPNPTKEKELRRIIEKLSKKHGESSKKGKAITRDILLAILDTCRDSLLDSRDRAVILFGWASGGRRRSEIADAELKDLQELGEDFIYCLPRSKTDQEGKGRNLPVKGMAALALKQWFQKAGIVEGKIFRSVGKSGKVGEKLTPVDINRIVKRRCKMAGYDPTLYSAHSLRSGFITEAGRQRCPLGDVMELSTHKSVSIAMGYYQAGNVANNSAANLV